MTETREIDRSVTLTLTAEDYVCANKLYSYCYSTRGVAPWFWLAALMVAIISTFAPQFLFPEDFPAGFVGAGLWIIVALPFAMYFVTAPTAARKTYGKQKTLHDESTISWSEKGYRVVNENGNWIVPWTAYLKRAENDGIFLFYQAPRLFNLLPKRVLTQAQIDDIRSCAAIVPDA